MNSSNHSENIVRDFIRSFNQADFNRVERILDKDLIAYVTNEKAGVDKIQGREEYLKRIRSMDIPSAHLNIDIKQIATVAEHQVLVMVEIHAKRKEKTLHNFAAHLIKIQNNKIIEM